MDELEEGDLPDVPDGDLEEPPEFYEYMIHTPSEGTVLISTHPQ